MGVPSPQNSPVQAVCVPFLTIVGVRPVDGNLWVRGHHTAKGRLNRSLNTTHLRHNCCSFSTVKHATPREFHPTLVLPSALPHPPPHTPTLLPPSPWESCACHFLIISLATSLRSMVLGPPPYPHTARRTSFASNAQSSKVGFSSSKVLVNRHSFLTKTHW